MVTILDKIFLGVKLPDPSVICNTDNTTMVLKPMLVTPEMLKTQAQENKMNEQDLIKNEVFNIMDSDKSAPKNLDKQKMYEYISSASEQLGISPIIIARIIERETHFTMPKSYSNGSGLMQLTTIAIEDMYQRPNLYDPAIRPILKKYGSTKNLMQAIRKNPELNVLLGTACFKQKLKAAGGDIKKALERYNGHPKYKVEYSEDIYNKIADSQTRATFSTEA